MQDFQVDVTFTDRSRNADGTYRTFRARVNVLANSDIEATQVACQICHCLRADLDPMILSANIVL